MAMGMLLQITTLLWLFFSVALYFTMNLAKKLLIFTKKYCILLCDMVLSLTVQIRTSDDSAGIACKVPAGDDSGGGMQQKI